MSLKMATDRTIKNCRLSLPRKGAFLRGAKDDTQFAIDRDAAAPTIWAQPLPAQADGLQAALHGGDVADGHAAVHVPPGPTGAVATE